METIKIMEVITDSQFCRNLNDDLTASRLPVGRQSPTILASVLSLASLHIRPECFFVLRPLQGLSPSRRVAAGQASPWPSGSWPHVRRPCPRRPPDPSRGPPLRRRRQRGSPWQPWRRRTACPCKAVWWPPEQALGKRWPLESKDTKHRQRLHTGLIVGAIKLSSFHSKAIQRTPN